MWIIDTDDVVYVDLGPVFGEWEADVGRTYAIGDHHAKVSLMPDLSRVFERVQTHFHANKDIVGAGLYAFSQKAADEAG